MSIKESNQDSSSKRVVVEMGSSIGVEERATRHRSNIGIL
jgi:hypothetical protein